MSGDDLEVILGIEGLTPTQAEAVEALVAENQQLRDALENFANPQHWGMTRDYGPERVPVWIGTYRMSPTELARAALDGTPSEDTQTLLEGRGGTAEAVSHNAEQIRTAKAARTSSGGTPSEDTDLDFDSAAYYRGRASAFTDASVLARMDGTPSAAQTLEDTI